MTSLDFEQGLIQLESKIAELRRLSSSGGDEVDLSAEIDKLESKRERQLADLYKQLNGAQKVQVARHPERPHYSDYLAALITDFVELAGDRLFAEDQALYGGLGRFNGRAVVVIGQEKGHNTASRIAHNFGMARPEGYRKAVRLMRLAERFGLPVLSFIDTAGAYPGVGAEQRGQPGHRRGGGDLPEHQGAADCGDYRRGRLGRRDCHCSNQSGADARACNLLGDQSEGAASILWKEPATLKRRSKR